MLSVDAINKLPLVVTVVVGTKGENLALCIDAGEYEGVSLFAMKIYEYLPEPESEKDGYLRVVDEECEPYYYDAVAFLKISARRNGLVIPLPSSIKLHTKQSLSKTSTP